jgi:5'-deoxynucleotidase YfbR-like HD superfamily hydrolase
MELDPKSFIGEFPPGPILSPEEEARISGFLKGYSEAKAPPVIRTIGSDAAHWATKGEDKFNPNEAWIQTFSGRRFNPTNPIVEAIVIQDVAHALSMQCRFSGHCKKFYSVAQHSVLVSYICNFEDALWGLLHDASEAYLVDVPRPLKHSGKFGAYIEFEETMQKAICRRFSLPEKEPYSVKKADKILLATEARDLLPSLRSDWTQPTEPLPFHIEAWSPEEAKAAFMKRFFDLTGAGPEAYQHYLQYSAQGLL